MSQNLDKIRHSLAHLLARAILEHFPDAKPTLGPPVDNGFYYDIDFGSEEFSADDLDKVESTMKDLLPSWQVFERFDVSADQAREVFADNEYKLELIDEIEDASEDVSLYYSGPEDEKPTKEELLNSGEIVTEHGFVDLCRGGHVEDPSEVIDLESFTLDSIAGAYWRGDENNQMLTRIYGLAFSTSSDLETYIENREAAREHDHRKLGKELNLFTFSKNVGPGLPMLLPAGEKVREALESYLTELKKDRNYEFVKIPHIAKRELYEKSGHMGKYDAMMPTFTDESDNEYVLKAMNCPHHFEIYNSTPKSYRDLPLRIAENTTVYRNEKSGELHGLTRVKNLTQDDTHHFIRPDQIDDEIQMILDLMDKVYARVGFDNYRVQISVRDTDSDQEYFGGDEIWERAESILKKAVKNRNIPFSVEEGEAAFYGPKIDVMIEDALGREWQLTTVQLDFVQPDNFDMTYDGEDGQEHQVVVIHAAILGSFERFMGVLIEHTGGDFPFWLAPTQLTLLPIADEHVSFAKNIQQKLDEAGFRAEVDESDNSLGKRIRRVHENKVPYFAVIGDDEAESETIEIEARKDDVGDIEVEIEDMIESLTKLL